MRGDRRARHDHRQGGARARAGRHLLVQRSGGSRALRLRGRGGARPHRSAPGLRHLPRPPDPRPRLRREDLQAQVRTPRRQPSREEPPHRTGRDHIPESRLRGGTVALRRSRVRADAREPERRHGRGIPPPRPSRLLGPVPPRGEPRAARQPLSLPRVHRRDGRAPRRRLGHRRARTATGDRRRSGELTMPRDPSIRSVLVIGSGPIVIGQACEFDYSGTQAVKVLGAEGIRVSLVNSNPATIMTDPEYADRTYVEPLTPEVLEAILERDRPDALLPTVGGQTALNLAVELSRRGVLDRLGVRLIGASRRAVEVGEDRKLFKEAMRRSGLDVPRSGFARTREEALQVLEETGLPAVIRPSFTLGGTGGGIAYNTEEFEQAVARGLELSPTHEILIEESVIGWKEYELEVMRDKAD